MTLPVTSHRDFLNLFPEFTGDSWQAWRSIADVVFGCEPENRALVEQVTGRKLLPTSPISELFVVAGRGSGKSRFTAFLAAFFATARTYRRAPGEKIFIGVFSPSRSQSAVTFGYIVGLLRSVPALASLIIAETKESVELANGIVIEVFAASGASPRARAYALVVVEEASFLPNADGVADPDIELLRGARPALARVSGSLLAVITSPYSKRGIAFDAVSNRYGREDDADTLVVVAPTLALNPTFSRREIDRAYRDDPQSAASEYGAKFRDDVSTLLRAEAIAAVVPRGVRELPPNPNLRSVWHLDMATGAGDDAAGFSIACADGDVAVLQLVRRWAPPFSPGDVIAEVAALAQRYDAPEGTVDRFAPGIVIDLLRRHGIDAQIAESDTSGAFVEMLALINSGQCRLLDDPDLLRELRGLERRTQSGGRDRVGHGSRGHDDVAAAAAFALAAAAREANEMPLMVVGGSRYAEWIAAHDRTDVEPAQLDAGDDADDVEPEPAPVPDDPAATSVLAGVYASARQQWARLQARRAQQAQARAQQAQAERELDAYEASKSIELRKYEAVQAAERREAERRAKKFADFVKKQPGGVYFPNSGDRFR